MNSSINSTTTDPNLGL